MKSIARLGSVSLGEGLPVRIMAAVNASPESFYKGSVAGTSAEVTAKVADAVKEGADLIDIGGASTAPYLRGEVSEEVESRRVRAAVTAALEALGRRKVPISVDTVRSSVAEAALRKGATVVNDVSGLKNDPRMCKVVKERGASLLAMAHSSVACEAPPIPTVLRCLRETLAIARKAGLDERLVVLDPGIGFFRSGPGSATASRQDVMPWHEWDCEVIAKLERLGRLGRPIGVGLSRKSFVGKILGLESPEERLAGSLAVTAIAVTNGVRLVRTHDVKETLQAVRVSEAVLAGGRGARSAS